MYSEGDEIGWAELETSVGEFEKFDENETHRYSLLHWVSPSLNEQGKSLVSAVVEYALAKLKKVEPNQNEKFLHTQT